MLIRGVLGCRRGQGGVAGAGAGERAAGAGAKCRLVFLSTRSVGMMGGNSGVAVRREVHLGGMG
jgi:hypothetical protein